MKHSFSTYALKINLYVFLFNFLDLLEKTKTNNKNNKIEKSWILFSIQRIILIFLIAFISKNNSTLLDSNENVLLSSSSSKDAHSQVKRFLNPRFGSTPNIEQLRQLGKFLREQRIKVELDEKKRARIYRERLVNRFSNSFLKDMHPLRF